MDQSDNDNELAYQRARIRLSLLRNALYHSYRRRFLEGVVRWFNFATVLLGGAAATDFLGRYGLDQVEVGLAVALFGALQLVWDPGRRASEHQQFQKEYYRLLAKVPGLDLFGSDDIARFDRCIADLSADEPPTLRGLDAKAYNDALDALGDFSSEAARLHIPRLHRALAGWVQFSGQQYQPKRTGQTH